METKEIKKLPIKEITDVPTLEEPKQIKKTKTYLTFHEAQFIKQVIENVGQVEAFKKNYTPFLVELQDDLDETIKIKSKENTVQVKDIDIELLIVIPEHIVTFLNEAISKQPVITLQNKLLLCQK